MNASSIPRGLVLSSVMLVISVFGRSAFSQTTRTPGQPTPDSQSKTAAASPSLAPQTSQPLITNIENIAINMPYAEVKKVLGKPDVEDDRGAYFTPSKTHSIQVGLDPEKKVRTIASIYADGDKQAPTMEAVIGPDASSAETGDVFKRIRYPDKGFWIAYSRTNSKEKPMTVVTMRRIE